jgi:guanine nucleotide-binding protein subunit beta-2-like 1 protein
MVSSSRDKSIIIWKLTRCGDDYGFPHRSLMGHSHIVQDVTIARAGERRFCLSGSSDGTLRLWDMSTGTVVKKCIGHTKDVLTVAFGPNDSEIFSGSRDNSIRIWTTLGESKFIIEGGEGHSDWVSCMRFSPSSDITFITCGWDGLVKVWRRIDCRLNYNLVGHNGYINALTISPDGSVCASGGKDGMVMLWDLKEGRKLYELVEGYIINAVCFRPNSYSLCAASCTSIKIWDIESKDVIENIQIEGHTNCRQRANTNYCTCIQWSSDGSTLYSGYTDGNIRVFSFGRT